MRAFWGFSAEWTHLLVAFLHELINSFIFRLIEPSHAFQLRGFWAHVTLAVASLGLSAGE